MDTNLGDENLLNKVSFSIHKLVDIIRDLKQAKASLIQYYKDLSNADEWDNFFQPKYDSLIENYQAIEIKLREIYENIIDKKPVDENEIDEIANTGGGSPNIYIDLSKRIQEDRINFRYLLNTKYILEYNDSFSIIRLLITRREAFFTDELFILIDELFILIDELQPNGRIISRKLPKFEENVLKMIKDEITKRLASAI